MQHKDHKHLQEHITDSFIKKNPPYPFEKSSDLVDYFLLATSVKTQVEDFLISPIIGIIQRPSKINVHWERCGDLM